MTPTTFEQLFSDLLNALKRLRELRTIVCKAEAPPDNYSQLAKQLHETVGEIRALQKQLLRAELTDEQQKEIRNLLSGKTGLTNVENATDPGTN